VTAEIDVQNVDVLFPLYHATARSLKRTLFSSVSGRTSSDARQRVVVHALRDISFSLRAGDRLGLVGVNGAGKTTLLRLLAGIYEPVIGGVSVRGKLNALLDASLGMNPDLTGRENIRVRGLTMGLDPDSISRLAQDIAEFAELGEFIDLPMRIYSSGMVIRLGFALATATRPQVLLMDEWFLAGDAGFIQKARGRLEDMVRGADILVLSSHVEKVVQEWCNRVIWLDKGRIRADGPTEEVMRAYGEATGTVTAEPEVEVIPA
jgi:lipopolysaccharide transport system ATP-binding protein